MGIFLGEGWRIVTATTLEISVTANTQIHSNVRWFCIQQCWSGFSTSMSFIFSLVSLGIFFSSFVVLVGNQTKWNLLFISWNFLWNSHKHFRPWKVQEKVRRALVESGVSRIQDRGIWHGCYNFYQNELPLLNSRSSFCFPLVIKFCFVKF